MQTSDRKQNSLLTGQQTLEENKFLMEHNDTNRIANNVYKREEK
jgi:hypothetical protein